MEKGAGKLSSFWNKLTSYFNRVKKIEKAVAHEARILKNGVLHSKEAGRKHQEHIKQDMKELCKEAFATATEIALPEAELAVFAVEIANIAHQHKKGVSSNHKTMREIIKEAAENVFSCPIKAGEAACHLIRHIEEAGQAYEEKQAASIMTPPPR